MTSNRMFAKEARLPSLATRNKDDTSMNPVTFVNSGAYEYLKSMKEHQCRITLVDGTVVQGLFMGINPCNSKKLPEGEGFVIDIPIYKLLVMHSDPNGGIYPVWVNTLLIDSMADIEFPA